VEVINPYVIEPQEKNHVEGSNEESGGYPIRVKMLAETLQTKTAMSLSSNPACRW